MQVLASTLVLGNPAEYFNTSHWRKTEPKYPKDPRAQFDIIRSRGATSNGLYAVKAHAFQVMRLGSIDPFQELPNLELVRIVRGDMLTRAISASRARQSRQYSSMSPKLNEAVYSEHSIRQALLSLQMQESVWDEILPRLGRKFLTLDYADLVQDPQQAADRVAGLMGVKPAPVNPALISVTVQRDESTVVWRDRFLADTGDEFRHLA
jgi:LPS sulfotransferase NodH